MDSGNFRDGQDATPLLSDMENSSSSKSFMVKVKCSDVGEIEMEVGIDETVDDFKRKLVVKMDISTEKRVRLIHQGKMLDPGSKRLSSDFKITAGSFIHCVVSNPPNSTPLSPSDSTTSTATGHAAASSSSLADFDGDEFNIQNDVAMAMNRSGSWRATPVAGMLIDDSRPLGTNRDFVWGVMMGYLLGGIMLFCVWDRNISHRQKTGILMGVTLQIITSIILPPDQRQSAQSQSQQAPGAVGTTGTALPAPVPGQVADVYSGILLSSTSGSGTTATVTATATAAAVFANVTGVVLANTTSLVVPVSPPTTAPTSLAAAVAAGAAAVYESMTATR